MKARIVNGGIGMYEVEYKRFILSPWQPVYNGMFPAKFHSISSATKVVNKIKNL